MAHATAPFFVSLPPWGLGEGPKGQISFNLNYKVNKGFRGGTWGYCGGEGSIFFSEFNQIWFVSYSHEWHMHQHNFLGPHTLGPWGRVKNVIF